MRKQIGEDFGGTRSRMTSHTGVCQPVAGLSPETCEIPRSLMGANDLDGAGVQQCATGPSCVTA